MAVKKTNQKEKADTLPMLKTVEQMSKVSGIGENKLRDLMEKRELEFIQNAIAALLQMWRYGTGTSARRLQQEGRLNDGSQRQKG